uniref:mitochondrial peptide methionine sulfoxide reductase isoform X5 n=1 Tax=Macaca mulatta TaxID=9544 RepID=UPI0010A240D2|nr:mitochondrial peptide methionine sulfoxide reductase isoform X5 [Macaca mulatta]
MGWTMQIRRAKHHVNGNRTVEPFPEGTQMAVFGMGCFWGAERKFWVLKGVYSTQVGFAGGYTSNPTYKEVCSEKTGHAEVVRVVYQPEHISFEELLKVFWENHDPTQGMRQGNDHGTQYRSAIYPTSAKQMEAALSSKEDYQKVSLPLSPEPGTRQLAAIPILQSLPNYPANPQPAESASPIPSCKAHSKDCLHALPCSFCLWCFPMWFCMLLLPETDDCIKNRQSTLSSRWPGRCPWCPSDCQTAAYGAAPRVSALLSSLHHRHPFKLQLELPMLASKDCCYEEIAVFINLL